MTPADDTTSRRGLIAGLLLGVPLMAYAVRGALVDAGDTHPAELARWIVGLALAHDLVLAPVVLAVGVALRRRVPHPAWPPVRAALLASAVLVAVGWPFARGYGRSAGVPSLLPRDYATGLVLALVAVWLAAAAWIGVAVLLLRRRRGT